MIILCTQNTEIHGGFAGRMAQQEANSYQDARNAYYRPGETSSSSSNTCPTTPCSNSSNTITNYVPTFVVQLIGVDGKILNNNGHTFNTPTTGFNLETSIFSVHIFPMSNSINPSRPTPSYAGTDGTYIVAYTLKDPAGSIIHKEFDQNLTLANLPHQIILVPNPNAPAPSTNNDSSNPQASIWTTSTSPLNTTMIANSIFIPNLNSIKQQSTRQQIMNGISPIAQKFLFTQSGSSISAYPISGTFDADNTATTLAYTGTTPGSANPTTGNSIGQFAIAFDGTQYLTFTNPAPIAFNQADLANGLILNVCIFASSNSNYPIVATLRTLDGLKLQKTSCINYTNGPGLPPITPPTNYLQSLPSTISIQYAPAGTTTFTTQLTTSFLNYSTIQNDSDIANQALIINGTINLRFIITRTNGNFSINMV